MNTNFFIIRFIAIITMVSSLFVSCDDDISDVGADALIGSELSTISKTLLVRSNQINIDQPRTNNLDYYLLGSNDHGFGNTNYSILTQINSFSTIIQDTFSENIDEDAEIISTRDIKYDLTDITLVIPFNYSLVDSDDKDFDNDSTTLQYNIESNNIIGEELSLNVYQSNFLLQQNNPNNLNNSEQRYYADGSDGTTKFGESIKGGLLTNEPFTYDLSEMEDPFTVNLFLSAEDVIGDNENADREEGDEHSSEGLSNQFEAIRIPLNTSEFRTKLLSLISNDENKNGDESNDIDLSLVSETDFTNLFRGLHIEVTDDNNGVVEILNSNGLVNAGIQLKFTRTTTFIDNENNENNEIAIEQNIISTLQFDNSPINIFTSSNNNDDDTETPSTSEENPNVLILQSGLGSIGTLKLLLIDEGQDSEKEFTALREDKALLNDAILELTVNEDFFNREGDLSINDETNENETYSINDLPDNLFITELNTGNVLSDYISNNDGDENNETLKENHLMSIRDDNGSIIRNKDEEIVYRINITEHLANIIGQDSDEDAIDENITLAISVTEDLNIITVSDLFSTTEEQFINQGSLLCFKTVPLYGSDEDDVTKRPRLIIKYTDTTN